MLSDLLADAASEIERYEKDYPEVYAGLAEEIRKVKLEMLMLQVRLDMVPPIAETITPSDLEWIRTEALQRGAERPPFQFEAAFQECWRNLWAEWKKTHDPNAVVGAWVATGEIGGCNGQQ